MPQTFKPHSLRSLGLDNNSLVAPIRGFDFGELLGTMEMSTSTTLNLRLLSVGLANWSLCLCLFQSF